MQQVLQVSELCSTAASSPNCTRPLPRRRRGTAAQQTDVDERVAPGATTTPRGPPRRVACAGFAIATSTSAAIPTGTFSQNTARHDTDSVSAPPINGPIARKIWLIPA